MELVSAAAAAAEGGGVVKAQLSNIERIVKKKNYEGEWVE